MEIDFFKERKYTKSNTISRSRKSNGVMKEKGRKDKKQAKTKPHTKCNTWIFSL